MSSGLEANTRVKEIPEQQQFPGARTQTVKLVLSEDVLDGMIESMIRTSPIPPKVKGITVKIHHCIQNRQFHASLRRCYVVKSTVWV